MNDIDKYSLEYTIIIMVCVFITVYILRNIINFIKEVVR